ncbi:MAG: DNA polymerase III subunit psi [Bacteroidota bacterium]
MSIGMMDKEYLYLLIHENIYLVDESKSELIPKEQKGEEQKSPLKTIKSVSDEVKVAKDNAYELADIPEEKQKRPGGQVVSIAIFHESSDRSDLELLQKIIEACKLSNDQYQVFANGFNKEVSFEKALVFVSKAKIFYQVIPYQNSHILCSKPLNQIAGNPQEKAMLWKALQGFISL